MKHKLFDQLTEANVANEEIEELYEDLRFIFENPFDAAINDAIHNRGALYIEQSQPEAH